MHLFNVIVIFEGFQNESFGYFTKNAEFAGSFHRRPATVTAAGDTTCVASSYTLDLPCGCTVYVSRHPRTGLAHTRVIEARGRWCQVLE